MTEHPAVTPLEEGAWLIDLGFQGQPGVIAAFLLAGADEVALIETGPTTTLPNLLAGIQAAGFTPDDVTKVLVTHIHLDHAGAAGTFLRDHPGATVYVHPIGAPHLVDPSRLLKSAGRIYGDRMDALWGEVAPIAEDRVISLLDGEPLSIAGRVLQPIFTPGHASHHVAYWDAAASTVFTGDVGGVRMQGTSYVCPPVPPPDLDFPAWATSVARLQALGAERLCPTHFGPYTDTAAHLTQIMPNIEIFQAIARDVLSQGGSEDELTARLHKEVAERLAGTPDALEQLEWATPSYMAAMGLRRWYEKTQQLTG